MVHRKNSKKYFEKQLKYQIKKDFIEIVMKNAVWDHFTGEVIGTLSKKQILNELKKKYGKEII